MNLSSRKISRSLSFAAILTFAGIVPPRAAAIEELSQEDAFNPEALYGPQLEGGKGKVESSKLPDVDFSGDVTTVNDGGLVIPRSIPLQPGKNLERIAAWVKESTGGDPGRPLPLAGSWNAEDWGPPNFMRALEQGHYVLLNFTDPSSEAMKKFFAREARREEAAMNFEEIFETYYKPGLEFARKHRLPISMRGWNWALQVRTFQERGAKFAGVEIPPNENAALLVDGKPSGNDVDPFGPDENWVKWGSFWFGNELMKRMQEVYPDPPLVIWLNNNEAGEFHTSAPSQKSDRFRAKFGNGPYEDRFVDRTVREAYNKKYEMMFEAAKAALIAPAWKENTRFIAYNTLWSAVAIGMGGLPRPGYNFENDTGWQHWRRYDGDMTEFYSNDWQPSKTESRPNGMQVEAINFESIQDWILEQKPDYFLTHIFWEGAVPGEVFRGRRSVSKPFSHIQKGERWTADRYEGWVQFCLWMARPRLAFEFRGPEPLDAVRRLIWSGLLNSVDRPWNSPLLEEFWRKGKIVQNPAERPFHDKLPADAPDWLKNLDRWSLLSTDANPPRSTWEEKTTLQVFAMARVLGEKPNRRWLVFAHAPEGARSDVRVMLPDYGLLLLPSVPQTGSFFLLEESSRRLTTVLAGEPDQVAIRSSNASKWVAPGSPIEFSVPGIHAPGQKISDFAWDLGDGTTQAATSASPVSHTYKSPGIYLVSLTAKAEGGGALSDTIAVYVGEEPAEEIIYDLAVDKVLPFRGPWASTGKDGQTLVTYQHIPNKSRHPQPGVAAGLKFVDDPEQGKVVEFDGNHSGIWLARNSNTVMTGPKGKPNRTVSLRFKADSVEGRQILYASGITSTGTNIYLDNGTLYAGSWAVVDGKRDATPPVYGYNWKGDWMTHAGIEPGKWYDVSWVLKDGANAVEPDRQMLFINGQKVASAPGAAIPAEYTPPRFGRSVDSEGQIDNTRFHDSDAIEAMHSQSRPPILNFKGRMTGFRYVNVAVEP